MHAPKLAIVIPAVLLLSGAASAMPIRQFDKMADRDQDEYVVSLITGAQAVLKEQGKADLAEKVYQLFNTKLGSDKISVGMVEFERNLARGRVADLERNAKAPNAPRLEVEHVMLVTLQKNDIVLPQSFMHVADTFRPKLPPR